MEWEDIPAVVDTWVTAIAAPAWLLKRAAADAYTAGSVGYYIDPQTLAVGLHAVADDFDLQACKAAAATALPASNVVTLTDAAIAAADGQWIKVAYSPTLRRLGELLNFFPGQYVGGIPNSPSPVAAMLTSGLVGAGLGYGAGYAAEKLLPRGYGRKLRRTGAIAGGMLGAAPGLTWGASSPYGWTNPRPLDPPSGSPESMDLDQFVPSGTKTATLLAATSLGERYKQAVANWRGASSQLRDDDMPDVNVHAVGQTLWAAGAKPQLAGTTMGALYAAQQMPDANSRPGAVTGHQLGQFAASTAGNYATGLLVGAALNQIVGTPYAASAFGSGNVILGAIGAVVPKLFGR